MTLSSTTAVRRGSTPLPVKHQLRREEAVRDDGDGPSIPPVAFSPPVDEAPPPDVEDRHDGPLRIALLGQNGVGKSSLAIALAGDMDRTASVDSEGTRDDVMSAGKHNASLVSHVRPNCSSACPQGKVTCASSPWTTRRAPSLSMTTGDRWAKQACSLLPHYTCDVPLLPHTAGSAAFSLLAELLASCCCLSRVPEGILPIQSPSLIHFTFSCCFSV